MLVYRYAPDGSRIPRSWRASPATSASQAEAAPAPGPSASSLTDGATRATRPACARHQHPTSAPKSFIYHFAVKALYPLI